MANIDVHRQRMLTGSNGAVASADTVDLADVARTVRRQWRALAICVVGGAVIAGAVLLFAPRRFQGSASVVLRASADPAGSILSRLGGGGGSGAAASASDFGIGGLLGGMKSPLETELQILQSRTIVGRVVDSLGLQVRVRSPRGVAPLRVVQGVDAPGSFKSRKYTFTRNDAGEYDVSGRDVGDLTVRPGASVQLPVARVVLRDSLPGEFRLQIYDREDAVTRGVNALGVRKLGGEVVRVSFDAPDSATAAAATNAIVATYLARRKTTDRSKTVERVEFLTAQLDTVGTDLAGAERSLRIHQEQSGVIDAPTVGRIQLEQASELRQQMGLLQVEEGALVQLIGQVGSGRFTARQLAAYPSFLKSPGINDFLRQLSELETERTKLLERRVETDPEVLAVDEAIRDIEAQLVPLATAYTSSLRRQRSDVGSQLDTLRMSLSTFPAAAQSTVRLQRDVMRLGQIHGALQAQLVEARLAAISEGGDVRQLDMAVTPKKVAFPAPALTLGAGIGGGLLVGLIAALLIGTMGRYMDDPRLIERAAGVPALPLHMGVPLLKGGRPLSNTVLLVPLDDRTSTSDAAERLVQTALARAKLSTVLDLTGTGGVAMLASGSAEQRDAGVNGTIERLEREFDSVIVRLPGLSSDATAAALNESRPVFLVANAGRVDRASLISAVETLRRLDVPCAGVVLNGDGIRSGNGRRWS